MSTCHEPFDLIVADLFHPAKDGRGFLQVQEPLLAIVRKSPDFEAAYNPLLIMARQLYPINPDAARHLLIDLEAGNPIRRDAKTLREYMAGF